MFELSLGVEAVDHRKHYDHNTTPQSGSVGITLCSPMPCFRQAAWFGALLFSVLCRLATKPSEMVPKRCSYTLLYVGRQNHYFRARGR